MPDDRLLLETLALLRARGPIGERSLEGAVAHADRFVARVPEAASDLVDLGSGGGLPGLVIAWRRPALRVILVERRGARSDLLARATRRLGLEVEVWAGDVADLVRSGASFDVVTARRFGPPVAVATWGAALLRDGGVVLVSEPPGAPASRWPGAMLADLGLVDEGDVAGIRRLRRVPRET